MRTLSYLAGVLTVAATLTGSKAMANVCVADTLMCATTMPVDGYCECTAHKGVEGGTVVPRSPSGRRINATAGGCGAHPQAPGCH